MATARSSNKWNSHLNSRMMSYNHKSKKICSKHKLHLGGSAIKPIWFENKSILLVLVLILLIIESVFLCGVSIADMDFTYPVTLNAHAATDSKFDYDSGPELATDGQGNWVAVVDV